MFPVKLPLLATPQTKFWLTLAVGVITVAVYGVAGEFASAGGAARTLPMTAFDDWVPMVPWTFWVYSTVYFIFLTSCALQQDYPGFSRFLYGYVFAYVLSAFWFILVPTVFPREAYPIGETDALTRAAFEYFRTVDHPTNCLPSMHVASCVMSTAPFYKRRPRVFIAFVLWALAISLTTLTTKQHYAIDIFTGAAYGLVIHYFFFAGKWGVLPEADVAREGASPQTS